VVLELKERTEMTVPSALRERDRMLRLRQRMKYPRGKYPKRGYLVYLAHYGKDRLLPGRKKDGARFFFEVPIVLETHWTPKRIEEWEGKFRVWSKFACRQKPKPKSK